jgi:phospholipid/cholesterol/gamma-HCH transport system ATP-binding protein
MVECMIEFRNVHKAFNEEIILNSVSFKINRGETKIILGGSGSGKSTILKLILGLIRPDSGQILIDGLDIAQMTERELVPIRRNIGMVFQEGALFDSFSVRENVGYRLFEEKRLNEDAIEAEVLRQLSFVGLEEAIDKMPAELSGGMKRRVGIARALVGTPKVVLYDEPTAGLDPITKRTIVELMVKLRDIEGVTSVFVTHDLQAASIMVNEYALKAEDENIDFKSGGDSLCLLNNHFIMLQNGAICFEGSYQEMMSSTLPYIRTFTS